MLPAKSEGKSLDDVVEEKREGEKATKTVEFFLYNFFDDLPGFELWANNFPVPAHVSRDNPLDAFSSGYNNSTYINTDELSSLSRIAVLPGDEHPLFEDEESFCDTYERFIGSAQNLFRDMAYLSRSEKYLGEAREDGRERTHNLAKKIGYGGALAAYAASTVFTPGLLTAWPEWFLPVGGAATVGWAAAKGADMLKREDFVEEEVQSLRESLEESAARLPSREETFYTSLADFVKKGRRLPESLEDLPARDVDISPEFAGKAPRLYRKLLRTVELCEEISMLEIDWSVRRYRNFRETMEAYREIEEDGVMELEG